ncbi:hypothetical protein [Caryophanon tenue]|uniref:Phage protein n=1 Tax=Caryophanon tenue TaxID=33978 RepID=A0A1C0Y559_9BACL|nr:hypothetical protein [Caryophanon tenue]OCS82281.1 hypothetical protein A6M13_07555 [Caryophanon tenue]
MTTYQYFAMAKYAKLSTMEMDDMSIGFVLGHIQEYMEMITPSKDKKAKVRKATQADIDKLKGF